MLTENQNKALKGLQRLKVHNVMNDDIDWTDFEAIFYSVLHEVDLYEEQEDCNVLTAATYKSAKNWLKKNKMLLKE
jgi:hypothetical protein